MDALAPNTLSVIYGLDDKPPVGKALLLALQHVLTMFGSTVAVPLLLSPVMWPIPEGISNDLQTRLLELRLTNTALLISSVMLCSGVATFLQSTFGSRLPIIQGVSFSFLAAFFGIIAAAQLNSAGLWNQVLAGDTSDQTVANAIDRWQGVGQTCMQQIAGAVILGAIVEAVVGFTGIMGWLRRFLSPVVIGPVIMLIGLALFQNAGAGVAATNWPISLLTMSAIILFSLVLSRKYRVFKLFPMLLAILLSVAVCGLLTLAGLSTRGDATFVDLSAVERSDWVRLSTIIFPWGLPRFGLEASIAVLAGYLASMIESYGDYHACKNFAGGGDPTPDEISKGIGWEGVACGLTGVLGGFSSTSYSENVGLVGLTKVGSRIVVQIGAGFLIVLGIFGKFGACAAAIPTPVVGGLYCVMFGLIAAVGVRQFAKADLNSDRNLLIGGFALFMGLSIPFYFGDYGAGKATITNLPKLLQPLVTSIGLTGMAVAAIIGLLLDNVIPGTKRERGLEIGQATASTVVPQVADVDTVE